MSAKTTLKSLVVDGGKPRLWTGIPLGVGVTYAATKVMPDFAIENGALYPLPYVAPAAVVGALMLLSPKTRPAGLGTLLGAAGYYIYAAAFNVGLAEASYDDVPTEGAPVQILGR